MFMYQRMKEKNWIQNPRNAFYWAMVREEEDTDYLIWEKRSSTAEMLSSMKKKRSKKHPKRKQKNIKLIWNVLMTLSQSNQKKRLKTMLKLKLKVYSGDLPGTDIKGS